MVKFERISHMSSDIHKKLDKKGLPKGRDLLATDVSQGTLGDCYYLAAIAALTERPELIHGIFEEALPEKGLYAMKMHFGGREVLVAIDDEFARLHSNFAFARSPTSLHCHLWVMLLEKAYAKLHGKVLLQYLFLRKSGMLSCCVL